MNDRVPPLTATHAAGNAAPASSGAAAAGGAGSAGRLIREARLAQGLHIAALAAAIKVSQHKLELLESDRVDQLPDATFARALAQTVCRYLKVDPQPVLAQLPRQGGYRLEQLSDGINMPFRDRPGRREPADWSMLAQPAVWAPALLIVAAVALYAAPAGWLGGWPDWASRWADRSASTDAAAAPANPVAGADVATAAGNPPGTDGGPSGEAPSDGTAAAAGSVSTAPGAASAAASAAVPSSADPAAAANGPAAGAPSLQLRANAESWVEVVDSRAQVLLARTLRPGETVSLEGSMPMRLKVGNAAGTEAVFRGRVIDLPASTRDNVARLELK